MPAASAGQEINSVSKSLLLQARNFFRFSDFNLAKESAKHIDFPDPTSKEWHSGRMTLYVLPSQMLSADFDSTLVFLSIALVISRVKARASGAERLTFF